ncbi:pentatricopeptide repeat-containing mitochondrial [Chlorella sorokiniana]|uniref:Pentatricopeptide repeat-containing mitochondrial n=1 Tax=Chlorella sorokiniana TaxID=3076 RepID=A0A2P6TGX5_CHLSO|nr:pentatricopeptide repeat-containing mitochondrial [Chlorella sorokiniana]|eukprot:PRW33547.1 pentatricopeptide repeat-containing mitochondrial [Chlorella sorokiniana]
MGRHSSDDSDSSRERKRHKKDKKEKKEKKEKHKHKKHKHSSKDKDKDKERERLLKEAKKFLKQKLKSGAPEAAVAAAAAAALPPEPPYEGQIEPIDSDSYFTKNSEFAAWLKESKGRFFSEQSTEENRAMFEDFVVAWNGRRLPARYYKGEVGAGAARTSHQWGIKAAAGLAASGAVGMAAALDEDLDMKEQARAQAVAERQKHKREAKEWLEDQVPRLAGKDKQLEEKRARRELSRSKDEDAEFVPRGMDVMGVGEDSFAAAKARQASRQAQRGRHQAARQAEVQARLAAAQAAEAEKMAQFKALLGAGPIQIAKRQ